MDMGGNRRGMKGTEEKWNGRTRVEVKGRTRKCKQVEQMEENARY